MQQTKSLCIFNKRLRNNFPRLPRVRIKFPNSLGEFFNRHRVLVELKQEILLCDLRQQLLVFRRCLEGIRYVALHLRQLVQKLWGYRQLITAGERDDLASVPEARAHNYRLVSIRREVAEDAGDALHTGLIGWGALRHAVGHVPIEDPADEGGNQRDPGLRACEGLGEREDQREVTRDALRLEGFRGLDALPRRCEFDVEPLFGDADFAVHRDELARLRD